MQPIQKVLVYASTINSLQKDTKRAWAEYNGMKRKIIRQKFFLRLYTTLLLGFLFAMTIDKLTS
jgi:hypothetical protein